MYDFSFLTCDILDSTENRILFPYCNNDYPASHTYVFTLDYQIIIVTYLYAILATLTLTVYLCMHHFVIESSNIMKIKTPDNQLLEQVKDSDVEAFRQLFEHYQPILFRQVLFQTSDTDQAHDIVQQTFISVWEHRSSIKPPLSFLAYILRISRNLIYDAVKHQKIRDRIDVTLPPPAQSELDDPAEALHLAMLQERITAIINDLPQKCREIFLLSRFEGKSNQEIADSLQLSVRTVEHQISNALKVLRKQL
jgi:RNA polymerase sigma-70 factor (ECF subfamily)